MVLIWCKTKPPKWDTLDDLLKFSFGTSSNLLTSHSTFTSKGQEFWQQKSTQKKGGRVLPVQIGNFTNPTFAQNYQWGDSQQHNNRKSNRSNRFGSENHFDHSANGQTWLLGGFKYIGFCPLGMTNDDNNASCFFGSPQSWNFDIQVDQLNWSQILGCAQMSIASNPPTSWLRNVVCVYIYYLYYIYTYIHQMYIQFVYNYVYKYICTHTYLLCMLLICSI